MNLKTYLYFIFILIPFVASSQLIKAAKILKGNEITTYSKQNLILIEFWASWCKPCIAAGKQLEFIQEQYKKNIFIITMSNESENTISNQISKYGSKLMVVQDLNGENFEKFQVHRLPHAVLLNTSGELIWQGHPASLTAKLIKENSSPNHHLKTKSFEDLISVFKIIPERNIKSDSFLLKENESLVKNFWASDTEIGYQGKLSMLLAKLFEVPSRQLKIPQSLDKNISLRCTPEIFNDKEKMIQRISSYFHLTYNIQYENYDVIEMIVKDSSLLWSPRQIDWGNIVNKQLIGEERVQIDNATIKNVAQLLSDIKNDLYVYLGSNKKLYDWDFHHRYSKFMKEELESSFGIILKPKTTSLKVINIYQ